MKRNSLKMPVGLSQTSPCSWILIALAVSGAMTDLAEANHSAEPMSEKPARPNIVVILSDDQGWGDIGYHGSDIETPHLDRLAREGIRFNAHYVWPTCSPTRAALLSGRAPSRYGILGPIAGTSRQHLPTETVTLADTLRSAGYSTAISGKWHLGLRPEVGPAQYGFDSTYGYLHGQVDPYTHRYKFGDRTWHRNDELIDEKGHATDLITDEAIRVIESSDENPFFLYVAYGVPHYPLNEPDEWTRRYEEKIENVWRQRFAASLTHMDSEIGRIVSALDRTGKRDSTLIIFSSDNGGQKDWLNTSNQYEERYDSHTVLGDNRPFRGWKGELSEGGIRVPAFVHWRGTLKPREIDGPVCITDWYPTLAGLAGVPIEAEWKLEGVDLWPVLTAEHPEQLEKDLLMNRNLYWRTGRQFAVRRGDWKLVASSNIDEEPELFHLGEDPHEKQDVSQQFPEKAIEMGKIMRRLEVPDRVW